MPFYVYYLVIMLVISALPFILNLKMVWMSFLFGALFFLIIYRSNKSDTKLRNDNKAQLLLASLILIFPLIVSILTFVEYESIYDNIIPGILVMDISLIFFQYFIIMPFSIVSPKNVIEDTSYNPMISIIVPAYNEEKWIKRTIESLLEIDYINKEIIVIDDGSVDKTLLIASSFVKNNSPIKVFKKSNGGKASAINYGLIVASGEIIAITDADGLISRNALKEIAPLFKDPLVVGVAGNIRVINKSNILTYCQALEYAIGINLYRTATASFGTIEVLPGPLSAFRRTAMEMVGRFDSDTVVEDSDFTKKLLKTGNILQSTPDAYAYTEVPTNIRDFIKQRTRWYRGNIQTFLKHKDIRDFSSNIFNSAVLMPISFLQIFIQPLLGLISIVSYIYSIYTGNYVLIQNTIIVFIVMQLLITLIAIEKGGEDFRLFLYSPFMLIGYKHLIDLIKVKCIIQHFTNRTVKWNKLERQGPDF